MKIIIKKKNCYQTCAEKVRQFKISRCVFIILKLCSCLENASFKYLVKISTLYDYSFLNYV